MSLGHLLPADEGKNAEMETPKPLALRSKQDASGTDPRGGVAENCGSRVFPPVEAAPEFKSGRAALEEVSTH